MVIMYARFHNYAAKTLAAINEGGRFTLPDKGDAAALKTRDEDLFQVARLWVLPSQVLELDCHRVPAITCAA